MKAEVGRYLDRMVYVIGIDDSEVFSFYDATVLLLVNASNNKRIDANYINSIILKTPLAIGVVGDEAVFDLVLDCQSRITSKKHIMTYYFPNDDQKENILSFLQSGWPEDKYFKDWSKYLLIASTPEQYNSLAGITKQILSTSSV